MAKIKGNGMAQTLSGTREGDSIFGEGGDDVLYGLDGWDFLYGGTGNDNLYGGDGVDTLFGEDGDDYLDGGKGIDIMAGGRGNDTYVVDNALDQVGEAAGEGTDTVISSVSYSLDGLLPRLFGLNQVENLTLSGSAGIDGSGNALDNILIGNTGKNALNGAAGKDMITGGAGADRLTGGTGADHFIYLAASDSPAASAANPRGYDTITDFNTRGEEGDLIDLRPMTSGAGTHALTWSNTSASAYGVWQEIMNGVRTVFADTDGDALHTADMQIALPGLNRALAFGDFLGIGPARVAPAPRDFDITSNTEYQHAFNRSEFGFSAGVDSTGYGIRISPLSAAEFGTLRYGADHTLISSDTVLSLSELDTLIYTESPDRVALPQRTNAFDFQLLEDGGDFGSRETATLHLQPGKHTITSGVHAGTYVVLAQAEMKGIPDMPYVAILDRPVTGTGVGNYTIDAGDLMVFGAVYKQFGDTQPSSLDQQYVAVIDEITSETTGLPRITLTGLLDSNHTLAFDMGDSASREILSIYSTLRTSAGTSFNSYGVASFPASPEASYIDHRIAGISATSGLDMKLNEILGGNSTSTNDFFQTGEFIDVDFYYT